MISRRQLAYKCLCNTIIVIVLIIVFSITRNGGGKLDGCSDLVFVSLV